MGPALEKGGEIFGWKVLFPGTCQKLRYRDIGADRLQVDADWRASGHSDHGPAVRMGKIEFRTAFYGRFAVLTEGEADLERRNFQIVREDKTQCGAGPTPVDPVPFEVEARGARYLFRGQDGSDIAYVRNRPDINCLSGRQSPSVRENSYFR